jgi:dTDP-4-dehydrorhamnose 3,5-epimerase-like enzyme
LIDGCFDKKLEYKYLGMNYLDPLIKDVWPINPQQNQIIISEKDKANLFLKDIKKKFNI